MNVDYSLNTHGAPMSAKGANVSRGIRLNDYITLLESGEQTRGFAKLLTQKQWDHFLQFRAVLSPAAALRRVVREGHL